MILRVGELKYVGNAKAIITDTLKIAPLDKIFTKIEHSDQTFLIPENARRQLGLIIFYDERKILEANNQYTPSDGLTLILTSLRLRYRGEGDPRLRLSIASNFPEHLYETGTMDDEEFVPFVVHEIAEGLDLGHHKSTTVQTHRTYVLEKVDYNCVTNPIKPSREFCSECFRKLEEKYLFKV